MILKRNSKKDFFSSELLSEVPAFKKYLLNVYLYRIPYSEGLYKYKHLEKMFPLIETRESKKIDLFLKDNAFSSKNKVIVITPTINELPSSVSYIKLESGNGYVTTIFYNPCKKNKACVVNLLNIPLFYKERIISNITFEDKFKGSIAIYDIKDLSNLW